MFSDDETLDQLELSGVLLEEQLGVPTLDPHPLHSLPQLDEVIGSGDGCDEPTVRTECSDALRRIPARMQRQDQRNAVIEDRKTTIGIGDHPRYLRKPSCGVLDCGG